jgi:hypothetical protein
MLHTPRFSLQNAVYFIMLHFLVHVLFTFYIQDVLKLNVKLRCLKVKQSTKRGISGSFSETVRLRKSLYTHANGANIKKKEGM